MAATRVIVIGAGVGGLSAAIGLAAQGYAVTVVERAATPGGKMRQLTVGGVAIDAGPTVFTMRWVFEALFDASGAAFADYVGLQPVTTLARHAWGPDERLDLFADLAQSTAAIGAFAGAAEAHRFERFCAEAARTYRTLEGNFMTRQRTTPWGLAARIGASRPQDLLSIKPFETLWQALGGYFHDPRLRQLFGRYATYSGASPFAAPATLMLIAHVENSGVWAVDGGMYALAQGLERRARELGVAFRYDVECAEIGVASGGVEAVVLRSGERLAADAIVVNADPAALAALCFGKAAAHAVRATPPTARSLSAMTWTGYAPTQGFPLAHHNVFFSNDYRAEFDALAAGRLPTDPSVYICAPDRSTMPDLRGAERLHMIVNAPATGDALSGEELDACETAMFNRLAACGLTLSQRTGVRTTPADFDRLFPATGGALYGRASHGWMASFLRPGARTRIPGLYLAGGATHPGAGVPMAAISGRLAASALMADRASTAG